MFFFKCERWKNNDFLLIGKMPIKCFENRRTTGNLGLKRTKLDENDTSIKMYNISRLKNKI